MDQLFDLCHGPKSKLLIPNKTNFEFSDEFLYLPNDAFQYTSTKNEATTIEIEIKFEKEAILFINQIKKDFVYTCSKYEEISNKWEEYKKRDLKNLNVNPYLILINDSRCCDTGQQMKKFDKKPKSDIFFVFTDSLNKIYFYGK